jgi:ribosomal protein L11 methyltransferase
MAWHSVDLLLPSRISRTAVEELSEALFELGCAGIETRDAELPVKLVASFSPEHAPEELAARVQALLDDHGLSQVELQVREEPPVDWATHWRHHFQPLAFGPLWVVPTWLEPPPEAQVVLRMDPGMAFGTGSHETTALCLERLGELTPLGSVLDIGTGTGILAMAALLLGADSALGTDNDPEALKVAAENAALNGLAERLELSDREPDRLDRRFDVVVANILAEPLIQLAPKITAALGPGGRLILSGILVPQAEAVARAYQAQGLVEGTITTRGEWARIDLLRPAADP